MKREKNYTFAAVVIILILIIIISAYAMIKSSYEDGSYKVSVIVENSGDEKWASFKAGVQDAADDRNVQIDFVNTSDFKNIEEQKTILDREILNGANAVITELVTGSDTYNLISEISGKAVLLLVCGGADADIDIEGNFAAITPDNYQIGRALGNEILLRHQDELNDIRVSVITGDLNKKAISERYQGLSEILEGNKITISWEVPYAENGVMESDLNDKYENNPTDIIVCLDDDTLLMTSEFFSGLEEAPEIYGEGNSVKNIFYLDRGKIVSMIVPDYFKMGYQSVISVTEKLNHKLTPMEDEIVDYKVINRENIFDEDNQRYLFTYAR